MPARREALLYAHFPPKDTNLDLLNSFRSPAHMRLIFEEFFFYQFGMALRQQKENRRHGIAMRIREPRIREALKRILPFKPTAAQKRVLGEIAADLERPFPMHRLARRRRGQRKNDRGAGSGDDRDRKRLPSGADGAHRNSGGAALSFRAADL